MTDHIQEQERESDPLDISARKSEAFIADRIAAASRHKGPAPTGFCLDPRCGEQLVSDIIIEKSRNEGFPDGTPRFCSADCRDSWEKHRKARERDGRRL